MQMCGQAAEYTRQSTMESIMIPVGPRLGDIVIEAKNLCKSYGDRVLMDNLSFSIPPGSVVGKDFTNALACPFTSWLAIVEQALQPLITQRTVLIVALDIINWPPHLHAIG